MKKIPRPVKLIFKAVISLAFFSLLLSFIQGNELREVFHRVNWFYMLVTFGITLVMLGASCAKWKLVLDLKEEKISFWQLLKIYLVGYFFSNLLPSTVGGDVVRSYYAGSLIRNQSYAAVSVFVERFSGILFLFVLVVLAPLIRPQLYSNPYILIPACCGLAFTLITVWIWFAKNPFYLPNLIASKLFSALLRLSERSGSKLLLGLTKWLEKLYEKIIYRLKNLRQELQIALEALKNDPPFLYKLIALTVLFYALTWVNVYTAFLAFNVELDFLDIIAIVPAIMLVAHLPITLLGNFGFYESVFVFYFLLVGVGGAESLAMALLLRVKTLAMGVMGFFTYLVYKQKHKLFEKGASQDTAEELRQ